MGKYAIIRIKGTQYKVSEGDELVVDHLGNDKADIEVLLLAENGKTKIGKPVLKGTKVKYKVIDERFKGKKIDVQTFKAKSRYRKKKGFRPLLSKLKIEKIS